MVQATCSVAGCARLVHGQGLCNTHYRQWRRANGFDHEQHVSSKTCSVDGCDRPVHGLGLCALHHLRQRRSGRVELRSVDERFDAFANRNGPLAANGAEWGPCHDWLGATDAQGYGVFAAAGRRKTKAHIYAFERLNGPVPLQGPGAPFPTRRVPLDHFACDRPICCNPAHVRVSTPRENTLRSLTAPAAINARKTHCKRGHPLEGDNLRINAAGERICRACARWATAKQRAAARGLPLPIEPGDPP